VRIHREPHPRQQLALVHQVSARHSHRFAESQPCLDAARLTRTTVVVHDPLDPVLPDLALGTVGEDQRIFDRNVDLVIEPVRHPKLELVARKLATMHPQIERMEVVVAAFQHRAQPAGEVVAHRSNSIASSATTSPAASTCARSAELRHRMGLVLLMWTRTVRFTPSRAGGGSPPARPPPGKDPTPAPAAPPPP